MTKLEECARALCLITKSDPDVIGSAGTPYWKAFLPDAEAVIRCLMDTSEAMMIIGTGEISRADVMLENYDEAVRTYRAMLQSVLDGKE